MTLSLLHAFPLYEKFVPPKRWTNLSKLCFHEIFLKNVGREGHAYYKHIYDNYENLSYYTIFLQGNPFDTTDNAKKVVVGLSKKIF